MNYSLSLLFVGNTARQHGRNEGTVLLCYIIFWCIGSMTLYVSNLATSVSLFQMQFLYFGSKILYKTVYGHPKVNYFIISWNSVIETTAGSKQLKEIVPEFKESVGIDLEQLQVAGILSLIKAT